jgi:hypothetical protein
VWFKPALTGLCTDETVMGGGAHVQIVVSPMDHVNVSVSYSACITLQVAALVCLGIIYLENMPPPMLRGSPGWWILCDDISTLFLLPLSIFNPSLRSNLETQRNTSHPPKTPTIELHCETAQSKPSRKTIHAFRRANHRRGIV